MNRLAAPAGLHVDDTGEGAPVVLLHSSGLSGRQWRRAASRLAARGLRAIVPDLSGHGRSPPWPEPEAFSYRVDVQRIGELVDGIGRPAHLVGHSYGGLLALLVAVAAPARARSLVLYDPVAFGVLDRTADAEARAELDRVPLAWEPSAVGRDGWLEAFVDYWGGQGAFGALREEARAEFRRVAWAVYQGVSTLALDETPAAAYARLTCPALVLSGEHTPRAARAVAERLVGALPRAEHRVVAGAGHMGPLTHADAVSDAIVAFVEAAELERAP